VLVVALAAMTAYYVRVGINLRGRGFTAAELATAIGPVVVLDSAASWGAISYLRHRRAARAVMTDVPSG
jgi:hypothetical protein